MESLPVIEWENNSAENVLWNSIGVDLYTVSKLLGHKTIQATQIYAKIVDEKKKAAMEVLPVVEISS